MTVSGLPLQNSYYRDIAITTADWDRFYKLLDVCTFRYRCENGNTLIGAAILKSGHPYIWATLLRAHN